MNESTPIKEIDERFICADCKRAALRAHAENSHSLWTMNFTYCPHTRRSLILKGAPGRPDEYMVSQPGDEAELKAMYDSYLSKYAKATERALADAALREAEGETRH